VRNVAAAVLLLASCGSSGSRTEEEKQVLGAFEVWRAAAARGDAEATFLLLTDGNKSEWLFQRMLADDSVMRHWRVELTGSARTDLDLWFEHVKKNRGARAEPLPATVLTHPWLRLMYIDHFNLELEAVKAQFAGLLVTNVYADETGATIIVRNYAGRSELYQMVVEGGAWKLDLHREALPQPPR
jgi:hypothetical protein